MLKVKYVLKTLVLVLILQLPFNNAKAQWQAFGSGMTGGFVEAVCVYQGNLYATGQFTTAGGVTVNGIAYWNGTNWNACGSGLAGGGFFGNSQTGYALCVYQGNLIVGGQFNTAGGVAANNIAVWNGTTWSAIGVGTSSPTNDQIEALATDGVNLAAGGIFNTMNGVPTGDVAVYSGGVWNASAPPGGAWNDYFFAQVYALCYNGGVLYAATNSTPYYTGSSEWALGYLSGGVWNALGPLTADIGGLGNGLSLGVWNGNVYNGGQFIADGATTLNCIGEVNGASMNALGTGVSIGGYANVLALAPYNGCAGNFLVAGGQFSNAGGVGVGYLAIWNGSAWSALGSATDQLNNFPVALCQYGNMIVAGGDFGGTDGGITLNGIGGYVPLPTVSITPGGSTSFCSGGNVTLTASGTGTTGYTWSPATGLSATTGATVTASPGTSQTYTVTTSNACGSSTATQVVTVNPGGTVSITPTGSSTICNGGSVTLNASNGSGGYTWSPSTGLSATTGTSVTANPSSTITYTVSSVGGGGCIVPGTITVTVNNVPSGVNASSNAPICAGGTLNLNGAATGATSWSWSGPNSFSSALQNPSIGAVTAAASGTYTLSATNSCGTTTNTVSVTINTPPTGVSAGSNSPVCVGSPLNLSGSATGATSWSWSGPNSFSSAIQNPSIGSVTAAAAGTYTLSATNACGTTTSTVTVVVGDVPSAVSAGSNSPVCAGNALNLTGSATGATSWSWSGPNSFSSALQNPSIGATTVAAAGTYTLSATNACGTTTSTVTVTINTTPTGVSASSNSPICSGATLNLNGSATGATSYSWTGPNSFSSGILNPSIVGATVAATGTYTLSATNGCGSSTGTVSVTVNATPTVTASATSLTICEGNTTNLNAIGATTYTWTPNIALSATTGSPVIANPTSNVTYTVVGTTGACSSAPQTLAITVNPTPTITASASLTSICNGGSTILSASGASSYTWTPSTALSATTGTPVTATPTSSISYAVTGANGGCNSAPITLNITVNPTPTVAIAVTGISPAVCSGDTVGMIASGANTYTWSPSTGLNATTGVHVVATPAVSTTYTVTGTTAAGCFSTATQIIVIYPLPTETVTPSSSTICSGNSVSLSVSGSGVTGYTWIPATGLSATTGTSVTANPSSTETYSVVANSINGCKDTVTALVTVNPTPTIIVSPGSPTICPGNSVTLTAASTATSYTWSPNTNLSATTGASVNADPLSTITYTVTGVEGSCNSTQSVVVTVASSLNVTVTPASPSICTGGNIVLNANGAGSYLWKPAVGLSCTTCSNPTATPGSTATYTVVGTSGSCSDSANVTITVNPLPTLTITPSGSTTVCSGTSAGFTASGASTYTWSPATGLSATTGATVTATPAVTTTYTATGSSISGCIATQTIVITVNPAPTVSINITGISPSTCAGDTVGMVGNGAVTYTWAPGTGLSATSGTHVIASPSVTTTYTVTGTDINGCTATASQIVTINPKPTVSISPSSSAICSGASVGLLVGGASTYSWSPSTGLSATTGSSVNATPATTQTYTVIGVTGSGCADTAIAEIFVTPTPTVVVTPGSPTICTGSNVVLTASGATNYIWTPSTALSATTGDTVTASPSSTTTYTVTGDNGACTSNQTVVVTVASSLNVTVTPSSPSVCTGDSITLNANGAVFYTWKTSSGLSCTTCSSPKASPGSATTYTVVGSSGTCSDSATVAITVNSLPVISVIPPSATICPSGNVIISATGGVNYTWSPASGLSATSGDSVTASPSASQTYTVTGTNGNGCSDTASVSIAVGAGPAVSIAITGISPAVCANDTVGMIAGGAATYTWSPAIGLSATTGTHVIASPPSTTTYTVTGTTLGGCTGTATQIITIYPTPTVTISSSTTNICSGDSVQLNAAGAASYSWSPVSSLSSSTGSSVYANPGVSTTYTVAAKSANGCPANDSVAITVTPVPIVTVTPPSAGICTGDSVKLAASGAAGYTWSPSVGLNTTTGPNVTAIPGASTTYTVTGTNGACSSTASVAISVGTLTVTAIAVSPTICNSGSTVINAAGATTYTWLPSSTLSASTGTSVTATPTVTTTYTLVGSSSSSCFDSTTVVITVGAAPSITVSASSNSICSGSTTTLTANGASTYTWSPSATLSASTGTSVTATPSANITYTVVGTTLGGCSDSNTVSITVNTTPTITITSSGSDSICSGQNVTLIANGSAGNYLWSNGATTSTIVVNSTGSYQVIATNGICGDTVKQNVFVYPPFTVSMKSDSICIGQNAILNVTASGGKPGYNYVWGSGLGTGPGPKNVVTTTANPYYACTVSDGCGDLITDSTMVYTYPTPKASFIPSPDVVQAGQFIGFINTSTGTTNYFWAFGDETTSADSAPYHLYNIPGDYVVTLIASNGGCRDSVSDTVFVTQNIFIPNVFTPNGDGVNDVFHVTIGGMQSYYIEIFNRWGEKLFEADSPQIDWDGRSNGGVAESAGTYYYEITATDYTGKVLKFKGPLELIR